MLSTNILNVLVLSAIILSVLMLSAIIPSVLMLSAIILSVLMLSGTEMAAQIYRIFDISYFSLRFKDTPAKIK